VVEQRCLHDRSAGGLKIYGGRLWRSIELRGISSTARSRNPPLALMIRSQNDRSNCSQIILRHRDVRSIEIWHWSWTRRFEGNQSI